MKKIILLFLGLTSIIFAKAQWVQTKGPEGGSIYCVASRGSDIFAGSDGGVFLSTNNGATWAHADSGLPYSYSSAINTLLFTGTNIFTLAGGGVYRSNNYGINWIDLDSGQLITTPTVITAINGQYVLIGGFNHTFISADSGYTWTLQNDGGLNSNRMYSFIVNGGNLLLGTDAGVYLSIDTGYSWSLMANGMSSTFRAVYSLSMMGSNLFAGTDTGIFYSSNNGSTWTNKSNGLAFIVGQCQVNSITVDGSKLYACTDHGLFVSTDTANSWLDIFNGITNFDILSLAVSGTNLIVGTSGQGVFFSSNNGNTWNAVNTGLISTDIYTIVANDSNVFAADLYGGGVFLSSNQGNSWQSRNNGLPFNSQYRVLLYTGTNLYAGTNHGLILSANNGSTWSISNANIAPNCLTNSGTDLYAGSLQRVYKYSGGNWYTSLSLFSGDLFSLGINGNSILAGTWGDGIYISNDTGYTWHAANNGINTAGIVYSFAFAGPNILAGTDNPYGFYISSDNGNSWIADSVFPGTAYSMVKSGTNIFAAASGGVFLSTDSGLTWTDVNNGLPIDHYEVRALAISGTDIYVGTLGGGVWRRPLSQMIVGIEEIKATNGFTISPNPLTSSSFIQLNAQLKNAEVVIYDVLGKEMMRRKMDGDRMKIERGSLESGVYFVKVSNEESQWVEKMVVE